MTDPTDWLDDVLEATAAPIPDDGFTDRVVQALPPLRPRCDPRAPILLAAGLLGGAVAFLWAPGGRFLADAVTAVAAFGLHPFHPGVPMAALAVLAAVVGSVAYLATEG